MKRTILSFLVGGICGGAISAALAQGYPSLSNDEQLALDSIRDTEAQIIAQGYHAVNQQGEDQVLSRLDAQGLQMAVYNYTNGGTSWTFNKATNVAKGLLDKNRLFFRWNGHE